MAKDEESDGKGFGPQLFCGGEPSNEWGPAEAVILIPAIRKTIQQLQEVLTCLERQAVATPVDAPSETPELEATPGTTS